MAVGPGAGVGVSLAMTTAPSTFKDFENTPNPSVFNGSFTFAGAGIALCAKTGCAGLGYTGLLLLGSAYAEAGFGQVKGLDFSASFIAGTSTVLSSSIEDCSCKK